MATNNNIDKGYTQTDKELEKLEKRIAEVYKEAAEDMQKKIDAYFERFKRIDEEKRKQYEAGEITKSEYEQWRLNQMARGESYERLRDALAERYTQANELAIAYVNNDMAKIYALNREFEASDLISQGGAELENISFEIYDEATVKKLIVEEPNLMPNYPAEKAVDREIDLEYGKKRITSNITSGILQGDSIPKIAKRLKKDLPNMEKADAVRTARTAITAAQNGGRQDAADELQKKGVILAKVWIATKDSRTRREHLRANGQEVDNDEPFIVGGEKLMYPGDSSMGASGWNIYNCRCSSRRVVKGFKSLKR